MARAAARSGCARICTRVETPETFALLQKLRGDYAQGFGIEHPRLLEAFTEESK